MAGDNNIIIINFLRVARDHNEPPGFSRSNNEGGKWLSGRKPKMKKEKEKIYEEKRERKDLANRVEEDSS